MKCEKAVHLATEALRVAISADIRAKKRPACVAGLTLGRGVCPLLQFVIVMVAIIVNKTFTINSLLMAVSSFACKVTVFLSNHQIMLAI